MAFGSDDAQAAQCLDLVMVDLPLRAHSRNLVISGELIQGFVGLDGLNGFAYAATQHNVRTTARHIGSDGDHLGATRLGHDIRLACMLFGVEHLVGQLFLGQQFGNDFRIFDGCGSHQDRLTALEAFANVLYRGDIFLARGLVDAVELVFAPADAVGRNNDGL